MFNNIKVPDITARVCIIYKAKFIINQFRESSKMTFFIFNKKIFEKVDELKISSGNLRLNLP